MSSRDSYQTLENALERLFPDPEEAFLGEARARLVQDAVKIRTSHSHGSPAPTVSRHSSAGIRAALALRWQVVIAKIQRFGSSIRSISLSRRRKWAILGLGVLLVAVIVVSSLGPAYVFAQIGQLLGYVPGYGVLSGDLILSLAEPVVDQRNGYTMRVEQVLALSDRTVIYLTLEGIPDDRMDRYIVSYWLLYEDGARLEFQRGMAGIDEGTVEYEPLPEGVTRLMLTWSVNDLDDWQSPTPHWEIPIILSPSNVLDAGAPAKVYNPENAETTLHDITIRVIGVSQQTESTALMLQWQWPEEKYDSVHPCQTDLSDETGGTYPRDYLASNNIQNVVRDIQQVVEETPSSLRYVQDTESVVFKPGALAAEQLTLNIGSVAIRQEIDVSFTVDIGHDPQVGDHWPLDVWFDLAGVAVHITDAKIVMAQSEDFVRRSQQLAPALELSLDPLDGSSEFVLRQIQFSNPLAPEYLIAGSSKDEATGADVWRIPLIDWRGSIQSGVIRIYGVFADLVLRGPWIITWEVPSD